LKTAEGAVVEEKRDLKQDVMIGGVGTGAGALTGLIFSNVARVTVVGLAGSSVYIVAKKGKEVELPAQTGMVVRTDSTVTLPSSLLHNTSFNTTAGGH
jgi:16S rRNA A1518/A1519 N6-dimethyltransferase RsmA/KsgA/DIM1 with predicted DNA glycosylase/AP lyase activity